MDARVAHLGMSYKERRCTDPFSCERSRNPQATCSYSLYSFAEALLFFPSISAAVQLFQPGQWLTDHLMATYWGPFVSGRIFSYTLPENKWYCTTFLDTENLSAHSVQSKPIQSTHPYAEICRNSSESCKVSQKWFSNLQRCSCEQG